MARTEKRDSKAQSPRGDQKATSGAGRSKEDTPNNNKYVSKASEPASSRSKGSRPDSSPAASSDGSSGKGPLRRAAAKVRGAISRARSLVSRRGRSEQHETAAAPKGRNRSDSPTSVRVHRETDIPMEQLEQSYTPHQTSLKSGFRFDGSERQRDQEFATGTGDERWNDEDLLTNKSGDPRIGTHGRTYEPGERQASSGDAE